MDNEEFNKDQRVKALKQSIYQKKQALQTIYEKIEKKVYPPEEILEQITELCKVSGVYIENKG